MERAYRLHPADSLVALTFGSQLIAAGEPGWAVDVLTNLPERDLVPAARIALASAYLLLDRVPEAGDAIRGALQSAVVGAGLAALAARVVAAAGLPGWCGLGADGQLRAGPGHPSGVWLDGRRVHTAGIGTGIGIGAQLVVSGADGPYLGSPLPVDRLRASAGFVAEAEGRLEGWAWYPADPERIPMVTISGPGGTHRVTADAPAEGVLDLPPLARPRRFRVHDPVLASLGEPLAVADESGRPLLGSPVRVPAALIPPVATRPAIDLRAREIDVVVPVFGNLAATRACLEALLQSLPETSVVHVVDDGSVPGCAEALRDLSRLRLHRHAVNRGFPAAANTGLRAAMGRDVVLLNSDTVVPPGWLERLRAAAYAAPDTGTATPLSGDGTIVSYAGEGDAPALDALAQRANPGLTVPLPVGVGFCLFIRRDCLDQVGMLREDLFAQGYGEESDFCLRARQCGWGHVAAADLFVAHRGGGSFGGGRADLRRRNQATLERLHPGYAALVAAHLAADPLFEARRRMDALRWAEGGAARSVLLVSHGEGGGVAELVAARAARWRDAGTRPVLLEPAPGGCRVAGSSDLRFAVPDELPALAALLRGDRPTHMEVHHLLGHAHEVIGLAGWLDIPIEHWVHDAASFCPRVALIGRERRYCGEPDVAACEACVEALGSNLAEPIGAAALVERSAADFAGSRRVVVPTADAARRIRRHFPAVRPEIVPWEDDRSWPPLAPVPRDGPVRICVVGAIGVEKGYDVLLGCAEDARRRGLALEFVVCGVTEDDERLMAAGPVFVTGRYAPAEAVALIRRQRAQLAFIPSIWPETWCFALSRAWQAGLPAVAFDLGSPAERIRTTRGGHLLPLGLPVAGINDRLLRLATPRAGLQPWRET